MNKLKLEDYNLETTLLGGQSFSWDKVNGVFYGKMMDIIIRLEMHGNTIFWQTYPENNLEHYLYNYLNLGVNYKQIVGNVTKDKYVKEAFKKANNTRILRQDFELTLLNFILTSHKSIKAVRTLIKNMSKQLGEKLIIDDEIHHLFPTTKVLAQADESLLRDLGAGFRAEYLKEAANKLLKDKDFIINQLFRMDTLEQKEYLLSFKGIGDKIADCILVFSLGRYDITPIDIWAKRVLVKYYNANSKDNYSKMQKSFNKLFGVDTAWAGQLLFEDIRSH